MTTSNDPDEIRAEIERTRAALSDDVDALTDTANPKNIAKRQVGKAKGALSDVKDRVMGVGDDVKERVMGSGGNVKDRVMGAGENVAGTVQDKAYAVGDTVSGAPETAKAKTRGNPLAAGLIAFGAGMVISSLIPSSQKEQDAVSNLQGNLEPLKEKATEAVRDIGEQLREPAQEAAESVKSTAAEGVQTVKDEGMAAKDQVQGQAEESKTRVKDQAGG
jgi:gas vesicle protein